jgi:hypothetical protein
MLSNTLVYAYAAIELGFAVGLQFIDTFKYEQSALPANPHVKTMHGANPKSWRAAAMNPFHKIVSVSTSGVDAEMLMADEAKRQLYAELVEYTLIPPLKKLTNIVATKMHLASLFNIAKLDKMLPGLGQSWACKGTLYQIFADQCADLLHEVHRSHRCKMDRNHRNGVPWHPLS